MRLLHRDQNAGDGKKTKLSTLQTESFVGHGIFWVSWGYFDKRYASVMGIVCGRRI